MIKHFYHNLKQRWYDRKHSRVAREPFSLRHQFHYRHHDDCHNYRDYQPRVQQVQPRVIYARPRGHSLLYKLVVGIIIIVIVCVVWGGYQNAQQDNPSANAQPQTEQTDDNQPLTPQQEAGNLNKELVGIGMTPQEAQQLTNEFSNLQPNKQASVYNNIQRANKIIPSNSLKCSVARMFLN